MNKHTMNALGITVDLEFERLTEDTKRLRISYPDYRLAVSLVTEGFCETPKRSISCTYNGTEIPLKVDTFDYERELLSAPAAMQLFGWIHRNSPSGALCGGIAEMDIRLLLTHLLVMYSNVANFQDFSIPTKPVYGPHADFAFIETYCYQGQNAVVYNDPNTRTVIVRFLGLNTLLSMRFGKMDVNTGKRPGKTFLLRNADRAKLNLDQEKLDAITDKLLSMYTENPLCTDQAAFDDWMEELYTLLCNSLPAEAKAAKAPAVDEVDEVEAYSRIEKMFYAQNTHHLLRACIENLPDEDRKRVLASFCKTIEDARKNIRSGDIAMHENGGRYLIVSNDGTTVQTLTLQNSMLCTESFPLEKMYPTGMHFDHWDGIGEDLAQYI